MTPVRWWQQLATPNYAVRVGGLVVQVPIKTSVLTKAASGNVKLQNGIIGQVLGVVRRHTGNPRYKAMLWSQLAFEQVPQQLTNPPLLAAAAAGSYPEGA